jgi:hypothetical protein
MGKLLLFLLLAVAGWLLWRATGRRDPVSREPAAPPADEPEKMVRCDLCGTYMPESESRVEVGRRLCRSPESESRVEEGRRLCRSPGLCARPGGG